MRICLDPGHGAGKTHNRGGVLFNEGDNNYLFSLVLKDELLKYENVSVFITRNKIEDNPSLSERAKMGNGFDLFLSIHSNAYDGKVRGTEIWDSVETPNREFAELLCKRISEYFKHNNRGVKYREGQPGWNYYGVLRFNGAKSSMIVENGFHDNYEDAKIFKEGYKELAKIYAETIAEFYNLKLRSENNVPSWKLNIVRWGVEKLGLSNEWIGKVDDTPTVWFVIEVVRKAVNYVIKEIKG